MYIKGMQTVFEENDAKRAIAENLSAMMHARGLTQTKLAEMAGVKQVFISRLLSQVMVPNAVDLANIADALGTTSDVLMTSGDVSKKSKKAVRAC
jgi:transcriptional regulator with XRE-family HTH domain